MLLQGSYLNHHVLTFPTLTIINYTSKIHLKLLLVVSFSYLNNGNISSNKRELFQVQNSQKHDTFREFFTINLKLQAQQYLELQNKKITRKRQVQFVFWRSIFT